jgi:hypothetical protein
MITKVEEFLAEKKRKIEESKNAVTTATTAVNEAQEKINEEIKKVVSELSKLVAEGHIKPEQNIEQVLEFFGFGKKDYKLDSTFVVDPTIEAAVAKRQDLAKPLLAGFAKVGLQEPEASLAVKALWSFVGADSIPLMNKYDYSWNNDTKILTINPNGKGLFNGHPIMG